MMRAAELYFTLKLIGMIKVSVTENSIHVSGHAGMVPRGSDIACAAVTSITLALIEGRKSR